MLIEEMKMPQLGESVTEGTISKWLVSIGDKVNKYDPIAEVMTDKVNAEVPSSYTGVIKELLAEEEILSKLVKLFAELKWRLWRLNKKKTFSQKTVFMLMTISRLKKKKRKRRL